MEHCCFDLTFCICGQGGGDGWVGVEPIVEVVHVYEVLASMIATTCKHNHSCSQTDSQLAPLQA